MNKDTLRNILFFVLVTSTFVWFGGGILRAGIAFSIFQPGSEFVLLEGISELEINRTIFLYGITGSYTIACYTAIFLIATVFLLLEWNVLKKRAWLFMSFILFYLSAIVEIPITLLDLDLAIAINNGMSAEVQKEYFMNRFTSPFLASGSGISVFAYTTIIALFVFKPLDQTKI